MITREEAREYLKRADITVGQTIKTRTAEALEMAIDDSKFLEFLANTINSNEMEQYIAMYHSKEEKANG